MTKIIIDADNVILKIAEDCDYAHITGTGANAHWEACSEEEARKDYNNKQATQDYVVDGGIIVSSENMIMPFDCGAHNIIETEVPDYIKPFEYKYDNGEFIINTKIRKQNIMRELEELDQVVNRATEDLYAATSTQPYSTIEKIIQRKTELRVELANLETTKE